MSKKLPPLHPGEILREEFLKPLELSAYRVAKDLKIPANRITGIVNVVSGLAETRSCHAAVRRTG